MVINIEEDYCCKPNHRICRDKFYNRVMGVKLKYLIAVTTCRAIWVISAKELQIEILLDFTFRLVNLEL